MDIRSSLGRKPRAPRPPPPNFIAAAPNMALCQQPRQLRLLITLLVVVAVTSAGATPSDGQFIPLADYGSERAPLLSSAALRSLVRVNISTSGSSGGGFATCGCPLPSTPHKVHCVGGYPVGGVVLEPAGHPTGSMLFLHGLSVSPELTLGFLAQLLVDVPSSPWRSTRVLLPLAPVYRRLYVREHPAFGVLPVPVHVWYDSSHTWRYLQAGALNGTTGDEVAASLKATGVVEDRLGLAASTARIAALVVAQARGRLRRGLSAVPAARTALVGHSVGGTMAWHLAVRSGVPWAGVVTLSGRLPLTPYYARFPELAPATHRRPFTVTSVAADRDTVVPPLLSEAAAVAGRALLGGSAAVSHVTLEGSDHVSYLAGDRNTAVVGRLLARAVAATPPSPRGG